MSQPLSPDLSKVSDLIRYEIFIPISDNEGNLFDQQEFETAVEELMEVFGGVTLNYPYGGSGGVDGMWLSSLTDAHYEDRIAVLMALSKAAPSSPGVMKKLQKKWEKVFRQEKILILSHRVQSL